MPKQYYITGQVSLVPVEAVAPPGVWPGPHPSHPIMLPGMPGWGSGGAPPVIGGGPIYPPEIGGGPIYPPQPRPPVYPSHPIYYPPEIGGGPIYPPEIGGGPIYPQPQPPVDPGYSPPWAQPRPPVDPGYSPPWAQPRPPVDPGYSPPWAQVPGRPPGPVDPGYSPPWARPPVDPGFGNPWFDPHPSNPIMLPGMPGWGSGGPVDPGYSPPWARPPVQPPPPVFQPVPPDMEPPPEDPTELPDMASPGYWCVIQDSTSRKPAFIQIAINSSEDHTPKPPALGTPGEWVQVVGGVPPAIRDAWVPTPGEAPAKPTK